MSYRPRFGYDIRINRDDAPRPAQGQPCAVLGCEDEAVCHAPVGPHNPAAKQWLCARHAREHYERWDYFEGMSEAEILRFQEDAIIGHRPTWPLGKRAAGDRGFARSSADHYSFEDGFVVFTGASRPEAPRKPIRVLTPMQSKALDTLGLDEKASLNEIKARYKELVKRFHPDANGGDRGTEERLKQVIKAYGVLRASGLA